MPVRDLQRQLRRLPGGPDAHFARPTGNEIHAKLCPRPAECKTSGFASNGYGEHSPGGFSIGAAALTEVVLTAFFLIVIYGATDKRAPAGFAPLAIGLCLMLLYLTSLPVTNPSANPAPSARVALFQNV